jgi:hypothetical protein
MDDQTLVAQYAQTGNLMDLCQTEAWLRESAQIEDEVSGQVEAGQHFKDYHQAVSSLTPEQSRHIRRQMKVQSILFTGLRQWMDSWDLGAGFEDTYAIARRLIRQHLSQPTSNQQSLAALLERVERDSPKPLPQQQVVALLSELFTPEDWQTMAQAASQSISLRVLGAGLAQTNSSAA